MSSALQTDLLLKTVGHQIQNMESQPLGTITEITRNSDSKEIAYLIIKSERLFGPGTRFFAIPASSALIKITAMGDVILLTDKDDLQFAQGVDADQCPTPKFRFKPSIFELYQYQEPDSSVQLIAGKNNQ